MSTSIPVDKGASVTIPQPAALNRAERRAMKNRRRIVDRTTLPLRRPWAKQDAVWGKRR